LRDDLVRGRRVRLDASGAGRITHRAEPNVRLVRFLPLGQLQVPRVRQQHPITPDDLTTVSVVDRRQRDAFLLDVRPDIQLGPVRQGEDADLLTLTVPTVVELPQFRPLVTRVPLAELVAEAEHAFLRPRLLLVSPRTAENGVEAVLGDGAQQRRRLQSVPARVRTGLFDHSARVDVVLHTADHEPDTVLFDDP